MDLAQLISTNMPSSISVGGAAISILAAIGTFVLSRSLEKAKAGYQTTLEQRKGELQSELEGKKRDLQEELEGVKAGYQSDLEVQKNELQSSLEGQKLVLQKQLEEFKAGISDELATQNARRSYEYEAKKNLYAKVEPLLFQLFEAAEGAFHAVTSLARTERQGDLPDWLAADANKYYIRSIIYRLFLPLAILRLIQRSTTLVDLNLDPSIRLRYAVLKESYLTWTDDFGFASEEPKLVYRPNSADWDKLRKKNPATFWRQGLVIGSVDRLVDAMVAQSMVAESMSPQRAMNFGEWEIAVSKQDKLKQAYEDVEDIFIGFDFRSRPVLSRLLIGYACMMHFLMSAYRAPSENPDLESLMSEFIASNEKKGLLRLSDQKPDLIEIVRPYVLRRLNQAVAGGYAQF
jgi:hypothetical protein